MDECRMDNKIIGVDAYNFKLTGGVACTLNATSCDSPSHSGPSVLVRISSETCIALEGNGAKPSHVVCYRIGSYESNSMKSDNPNSGIYETGKSMTLDLNCANPACNQGGNIIVQCYEGQNCLAYPGKSFIVRRLTPLECSRLQGFSDWWTDGVDGADSNIYKMWGNGIALPCAADVIGRLAKELGATND